MKVQSTFEVRWVLSCAFAYSLAAVPMRLLGPAAAFLGGLLGFASGPGILATILAKDGIWLVWSGVIVGALSSGAYSGVVIGASMGVIQA